MEPGPLRAQSFAARWWRQLGLAAVAELISVLGTLGATHQLRAVHIDAVGLALVALASATVAVARRWPAAAFTAALAATFLYVVLGYPTDSPHFLGLLVTAYLVPAPATRGRTALLAVATIVAFAATAPLTPNPSSSAWPALGIITLVALAAGQIVSELNARTEARAEHIREEAARQRLMDERLAIARELHDVVSHSIAMINVQAGVGVHVMDERPEQAREALLAIKAASHDAMQDLRAILGLLRQADAAEPRGPMPGLERLADLIETVRRAGVNVSLDEAGVAAHRDRQLEGVSGVADLAAYRVLQEALTNVVRHAPGAVARVLVRCSDSELVVEVENGRPTSGRAVEPRRGAGHGLAGMRERVHAAGGEIEAGPQADGGFRVRARIPLMPEGS